MSGSDSPNGQGSMVRELLSTPTRHQAWSTAHLCIAGDIIGLNLLGQPMIVLNSAEHAIALLEKRGTLYSDRPVLTMGGELVGWKYTLGLTPYGDRFRDYRRYIGKAIGGRDQMQSHLQLIEHQTAKFLWRVLNDPDHVSEQIRK